jgi:hypothetical protein
MAQTSRKRRSKHRGNAAGAIEARGRTGRAPSADEKKKQARESARETRLNTPPTWRGALKRGLLAAGFMLIFLIIIQKGSLSSKVLSGLIICVFAVLLYTPAGYYLELWMWRRRMAKQGKPVKR